VRKASGIFRRWLGGNAAVRPAATSPQPIQSPSGTLRHVDGDESTTHSDQALQSPLNAALGGSWISPRPVSPGAQTQLTNRRGESETTPAGETGKGTASHPVTKRMRRWLAGATTVLPAALSQHVPELHITELEESEGRPSTAKGRDADTGHFLEVQQHTVAGPCRGPTGANHYGV
jgi:hypothetical protein